MESILEQIPGIMSNNEYNTNADIFCLDNNYIILEYTQCDGYVYAYEKISIKFRAYLLSMETRFGITLF